MVNGSFVTDADGRATTVSHANHSALHRPRRGAHVRRCRPTRGWVVVSAALVCLAVATPARADFTAFLGASPKPETRLARGLALGSGVLVLGWEFEYASLAETDTAPGLTTGFGNLLLQTPGLVSPVQVYGTTGVGIFRERFGLLQETNVGSTFGGGVKIRVAGPVRLRLDYRIFKLQGSARESNPQRFYAGMNVGF